MDTWATSSLTPQIAARWADDPELFARLFPMDIRPQGPEIIRTWLFSTIVRSHYEHGSLPWSSATLNGWILDPDRKKMSKSKGNVVTPLRLFEQYGTDAVRYWAISARPGVDTAVSEEQMKVGRRLAIKLLNVTKFVLGIAGAEPADGAISDPVDRAMVTRLDAVVAEATAAFEGFDYARALERTEAFFWWFCDDYVELVKGRAYGNRGEDAAASARAALRHALGTLQRLLAPTLPFAAEEAWSWWHDSSIHAERVAGAGEPGRGRGPVAPGSGRRERDTRPGAAGQDGGQAEPAGAGRPGSSSAPRPRRSVEPAREDLVDTLTVTELELLELPDGDELALEITVG